MKDEEQNKNNKQNINKGDDRIFFADYIQRCAMERGFMTYPELQDAIKVWDETMPKSNKQILTP